MLIVAIGVFTHRAIKRNSLWLGSIAIAGVMLCGLERGAGSDYLYGQKTPIERTKCPFFKVGSTADVRVTEDSKQIILECDGIPISGSGEACAGELALACLPRFLRPNAGRTMVLGFGTGTASGVSTLLSENTVICAEAEPAVGEASILFSDLNFHPEKSKGFSRLDCSGEMALKGISEGFDLVLVNYGNLRLSEARHALTGEFYRKIKSRLTAGGIMAQRLDLGSVSPRGLSLIARTVSAAFSHYALTRLSDYECILLASDETLRPSREAIHSAQLLLGGSFEVSTAMEAHFGATNVARFLVSLPWLDETGVRNLGKRDFETTVINHWTTGLVCGGVPNSHWEFQNRKLIDALFDSSVDPDVIETNFILCGCSSNEVDWCRPISALLMAQGKQGAAIKIVDWALCLSPNDSEFLADRLISSDEDDPETISKAVDRIAIGSIAAANRVGVWLWRRQRFFQARSVFEKLTTEYPQSATLHYNLGKAYETIGDKKRAIETFDEVLKLDPCYDRLNP